MNHKTVLITGASGGIGSAIIRAFAEHKNDYRVILNYCSSEEKAKNLAAELKSQGCDALAVKADVSSALEVEYMLKLVQKFSSHIDVLVNNAGVCARGIFCEQSPEVWNRIFSINVMGMFNCCRAVLPGMIRRRCGKIINISSIAGTYGASLEAVYSSSKAAIIGFTKALAKEVGPSGVNVNCVAPGFVDTKMNKNLNKEDLAILKESTPLRRFGTVDDVAYSVFFLASEKSSFITGQTICVDGGLVI